MNTNTAPEIHEAFAFAGLTTETSRWGHTRHRTADGRQIQLTEEDGTYRLLVFTGRAELIESELVISGRMANPATLAAMLEMAAQ